jgi:hypothetical protein
MPSLEPTALAWSSGERDLVSLFTVEKGEREDGQRTMVKG